MTAYEKLGDKFPAGACVVLKGQEFISHGCAANGFVTLANPKLKTTRYVPIEKLDDERLKGRLIVKAPTNADIPLDGKVAPISIDLTALDPSVREATLKRLEYVRAIERGCYSSLGPVSLEPLIAEVAARIKDPATPNWRSVIRWHAAFQKSQISGLIHRRRGNTHCRLNDAVEDLMYLAITQHYMVNTCPSLDLTHKFLKGKISEENKRRHELVPLLAPSYNALRRRVEEFDPFELMCARKGVRFATNYYRTRRAGPKATRPLEVVQIDHTRFDAEVVHMGVLRLEKPTLTIARDQFSGAILGFYLGFEPAGYQSVMECLLTTILPKDHLTANIPGLHHAWNMYGIPEKILVDNGAEFTGDDLKNACAHLNIDIEYCPPGKPWFKPHVERLFGVLRQQFTNRLPGRTFTVHEESGDYEVDDQPLIELEDLQRILTVWIVDFFNESPYGFSGMPPSAAWDRSAEECPPRMDKTEDEVRIYCGRCVERELKPYGIEFEGMYYSSDGLSELRRHTEATDHFTSKASKKTKGKVLVKFDPRDIGKVWVLDRIRDVYVEAKAGLEEYATGLSLHRHKLNLREAKQVAKEYVDEAALLAASERIQKMINELSLTDAKRLGALVPRALMETSFNVKETDERKVRSDVPASIQDPAASATTESDVHDVNEITQDWD